MLRWCKKAADHFGGFLFVSLFVVFIVQVVARFIFNKPLPWTDELAVVLYVWVILWAAAFIVPEREHVMIDLVWNSAPQPARRCMKIGGNLMIGGLCLWAMPGIWDYVHFMARESTPVLGISFQWVFMPFMFLFGALVLRSIHGVWQGIRGEGLEAQLQTP